MTSDPRVSLPVSPSLPHIPVFRSRPPITEALGDGVYVKTSNSALNATNNVAKRTFTSKL